MSVDYMPAQLSVGVEAALQRLASACRRDGYRMDAHLLLTCERSGEQRSVVWHKGDWYELVEVGDAE